MEALVYAEVSSYESNQAVSTDGGGGFFLRVAAEVDEVLPDDDDAPT